MRKQIFVGVALFWLGVGIGMVAMQIRSVPKTPLLPKDVPWEIACLTLDDGWVCAFNGKELRYDKNGYIMEPK